MSFCCRRTVFCGAVAVLTIMQSQSLFAAGFDLGGALNKAKEVADTVSESAAAATVPSGATKIFNQVDKDLAKVDQMLSGEGITYDKDYRAKEAAFRLKEAQDGMETAEGRYGSKMGAKHPEFVSRRDRIAALEPKVAAFKEQVASEIEKEEAEEEAARKEEAARQTQSTASPAQQQQTAQQPEESAPSEGTFVFSKKPINPADPKDLTNTFKAGDHIYGMLQLKRSWREILKAGDKKELAIMVGVKMEKMEDYQYVTLKNPKYIDSKFLVLDVAPAIDKMTAYRNPDITWGEGKGGRKIGPMVFTYDLGQLPAGKHTAKFYVRDYGEYPVTGELTIEGDDFAFYADLHEKVKKACESIATLPPAGMVNKDLESQMRTLLDNAGWTNVLRVVIIDKDWWVEDNASRYLNVAVAAKDGAGECYWCNTTFTQPRLLDGSWGKLELTFTGTKRTITEENVNK